MTRRGFRTAAEAAQARRAVLEGEPKVRRPAGDAPLTVSQLLDLYLADAEINTRLAPKTLFDYRHNCDHYIRPWIGDCNVGEVTSETIAAWQAKLLEAGGAKTGRALSPNTVRLARAPLNGAFKYVSEPNRRQGHGRALVEAFVESAGDRTCTEVWVLTDDGNPPALRTYEKAGGQRDPTLQTMFSWKISEGRHSSRAHRRRA